MNKKYLLLLLFISGLFAVAQVDAKEPLKVGFVMQFGSVNDAGWNYQHEQGRLYLQRTLKDQVETSIVENIPENAEAERVMEKMIAKGCKLIFTTSYGYLEPATRVALRHPDVVIMQCQRIAPKNVKNIGTYFANQYDLMYITGFVAGKVTKTTKLGFISAHPVPVVLTCLNSFALGARSANPKVKVQAVWINSWSDPALEAEATKSLIDYGCDVINCQLGSAITVVQTAERQGVYSEGCNADFAKLAPKGWLVGTHFNWGPLYVKIAQSVLNHTWVPGDYYYDSKAKYHVLSSFGQVVPNVVRAQAKVLEEKIEQSQFFVFHGPIKDQDGKLRISPGKIADSAQIRNMNWLVEGVEGSLPKK